MAAAAAAAASDGCHINSETYFELSGSKCLKRIYGIWHESELYHGSK